MTITRVNPSGWAANEILTSAEMNAVDINVTSALDKRSAQTDTLSSIIDVASGGILSFLSGSSLATNAGATSTFVGDVSLNSVNTFGSLSVTTVLGAVTFSSPSVLTLNGFVTCLTNKTSDLTFSIATPTSDAATHDIHLTGQSPYIFASTNTRAGSIYFDINGSGLTQTDVGGINFTEAGDTILSIKRSGNINNDSSISKKVLIFGGSATQSMGLSITAGIGLNSSGSAGNAGGLELTSGSCVNNTNVAGNLTLTGGASTIGSNGTGGSINLTAGQGSSTTTGGGNINISGAAGFNQGGTSSSAGNIIILAGNSSNVTSSTAGHITITAGYGIGTDSIAGDIKITAGLGQGSSSSGGNVYITGGYSIGGGGPLGNIAFSNSVDADFGFGEGVIFIPQDAIDPSANPTAGVILYVDSSGNLKCRTNNGNVSIMATNTTLPAYTMTNVETDRALNGSVDTLEQVADVLGTLISDLQTREIIG